MSYYLWGTLTASNFHIAPGHKRRETIQVPSLAKTPTIAPRGNRSAELRKAKEQANKLAAAADLGSVPSARTSKIKPMVV